MIPQAAMFFRFKRGAPESRDSCLSEQLDDAGGHLA
jgi:hypothetical protein